MSVKRLANGRYKARVRLPDGREISHTTDLKRDADEWADAQRTDMRRGTWVDPRLGRQTFLGFADEWAAVQDGWKQTTRDNWPYVRARLEPLAGSMPLGAFTPLMLKKLRADLGKRYAPATVSTTMRYAGMILRAAHAEHRIGRDPTAGVRAPRQRVDVRHGQVGPDQVPTRVEAAAILAAAPDRYRAAVALGLAGLRVGEVLGMTADRVDLAARRVTVDRQAQVMDGRLQLTTPKAEKTRTIVVPALVAVELRRHLRDHVSDGLLFPGTGRVPLRRDQFYQRAWRPALASAGLTQDRFKFHACRHFCASVLLAEGASLSAVAGYLGNTVDMVSRTYVHWLRDERDVAADVMDRAWALARQDAASARPRVV